MLLCGCCYLPSIDIVPFPVFDEAYFVLVIICLVLAKWVDALLGSDQYVSSLMIIL